jgi:hypothetical protein
MVEQPLQLRAGGKNLAQRSVNYCQQSTMEGKQSRTGRTRFPRVSASNSRAHFLVINQPLQQTPNHAPTLGKSSLLPGLLCFRRSAYFGLDIFLIVGNISSNVQ